MDKKLVTRKQSVAVAVAMAFVAVSNVAQADSAFEWAYWDASPSAGANSAPAGVYPEQVASLDTVKTYNGYDNITAEQMRIGFNGGELLEASTTPVTGTWVGYTLFDTRLDTGEVNSEVERTTNNVAVLGFTPGVGSDTLSITSDLEVLKMDFDNTNPDADENRRSLTIGPEEGEIVAIYNSSSPDARRTVKAYGERLNDESDEHKGQYISKIDIEKYTTVGTLFGSFGLNGSGFIGKVMPLADIAYQTKMGASYDFKGRSVNGSNVFIAVNFGASTWRADFEQSKYNYGYSVENGTISGATLTSANVIGDVNKLGLAESVVSGKVTGTLIGVLNASSSNAGVIGKSELNVLVADHGVETVKVNDVFAASIVDSVKK